MEKNERKWKKVDFFVIFAFALFSLRAEKITFRADSMHGSTIKKSESTVLEGNAFVQTETMEISADKISLNGENFRYIFAEGAVTGKNHEAKMDFSAGKMSYDRETKIALLENSVHLVDLENDVTADAQIIEYNQNTEIAKMQISITILQKDNRCTGAFALYRKSDSLLQLSGNPKIVQKDDVFRAQEITLNLDTQEITLDSRVSGTVTDNKENENPENSIEEKSENTEKLDDKNLNENLENPENPNGDENLNGENPESISENSENPNENSEIREKKLIEENLENFNADSENAKNENQENQNEEKNKAEIDEKNLQRKKRGKK